MQWLASEIFPSKCKVREVKPCVFRPSSREPASDEAQLRHCNVVTTKGKRRAEVFLLYLVVDTTAVLPAPRDGEQASWADYQWRFPRRKQAGPGRAMGGGAHDA